MQVPMQVQALDHVNVITADLERACAFYTGLLGLERRDGPPPLTPRNAQWMHDPAGRAIIHINTEDCPRTFDRRVEPGALTGAVHHVALSCSGHDELVARMEAMGLPYQENFVASIGLRQVFVADPDNVLLELNFFGE